MNIPELGDGSRVVWAPLESRLEFRNRLGELMFLSESPAEIEVRQGKGGVDFKSLAVLIDGAVILAGVKVA